MVVRSPSDLSAASAVLTTRPGAIAVCADKPWLASLILSRGEAAGRMLARHVERLAALPRRIRRRWRHVWALALPAAALLFALMRAPAWADAITVTSVAGGVGGPGCTLRDAITTANADAGSGGCAHSGVAGADTILLPAGQTITLSATDNTVNGPNGLPSITSAITIEGQATVVERAPSASEKFRLFHIDEDASLTLDGVTLRGGETTEHLRIDSNGGGAVHNRGTALLTDCILTGNRAGDIGGAVQNLGSMSIVASTIDGNTSGRHGGGVANLASLSVYDSRIAHNVVPRSRGGSIYHRAGRLRIVRSEITENRDGVYAEDISADRDAFVVIDSVFTNNHGCGIAMEDDALIVERSTISGNSGCGISGGDTGIINNSVISNNTSTQEGGGLTDFDQLVVSNSTIAGNSTARGGGGIQSYDSDLTITNSTISHNTAAEEGGGIEAYVGALTVINSTISDNVAREGGGLALYRSLNRIAHTTIFGNSAGEGGAGIDFYSGRPSRGRMDGISIVGSIIAGSPVGPDCDGDGFTGFGNLIDDHATGACSDISDAAVIDLAGVLADHGGPTLTHALLAGSNAVDAVACDGLDEDQRGAPRPNGTTCDIGAVEYGAVPSPRPTSTDIPTPTAPPPPATATPLPSATAVRTSGEVVLCPGVDTLAPRAAIDQALLQPERLADWNQICYPGQPPSWWNAPRRSLALRQVGKPYHPLVNTLILKCGCP